MVEKEWMSCSASSNKVTMTNESLTRIFPVNKHLSTRSVDSEPAVNSLKSSSLGTSYVFVPNSTGSRNTTAIKLIVGCVKVGGKTCPQLDFAASYPPSEASNYGKHHLLDP